MCDRLECDEEDIGGSARTLWERLMEHLRATSSIYDHANTSGHHIKLNNFSVLGRESHTIARTIQEARFIRVNDPSPNRNIGKYQLPHIWDEVLINTPDVHLKETLFPMSTRPTAQGPQHQPTKQCRDPTQCVQHQQLLGIGPAKPPVLEPNILAPGASFYTAKGAICGKYYIW